MKYDTEIRMNALAMVDEMMLMLEREMTGSVERGRQKQWNNHMGKSFEITDSIDDITENRKRVESGSLCGQISMLDKRLISNIESINFSQYVFTQHFTQYNKSYRESIELSDTVALHVPSTLLKDVLQEFSKFMNEYCDDVHKASFETIKCVMKEVIDIKKYGKVIDLLLEKVDLLMKLSLYSTKEKLRYILLLEWEYSIGSIYFKDNVKTMRSSLFGASNDNKKELSDLLRRTRTLNNNEKRYAHEKFAYWRVMKHRIIDKTLMTTRFELMWKPLNESLRDLLREVFVCGEMFHPLCQDETMKYEREGTKLRYAILKKARKEVKRISTKISATLCAFIARVQMRKKKKVYEGN